MAASRYVLVLAIAASCATAPREPKPFDPGPSPSPSAQPVAVVETPKMPERRVVAVFDLDVREVQCAPSLPDTLTEIITSRLAASGQFHVVSRAEIQSRLRNAQADTYKACFDEQCQIELGKELAAAEVLRSSVRRIGPRCQVNLQLFDLKRATASGAGIARGPCSDEMLVDLVEEAVAELLGLPIPKRRQPEPTPQRASEQEAPIVIVDPPPPPKASRGAGCADGTREGFKSAKDHPTVAACGPALTYPEAQAANGVCAEGWRVCTMEDVNALKKMPETGFLAWVEHDANMGGNQPQFMTPGCAEAYVTVANLRGTRGCSASGIMPEGWRLAIGAPYWAWSHDTEAGCVEHAAHVCGFSGGPVPANRAFTACCKETN